MSLKAKLEAVIYAAEEPVTLAQLALLFTAEVLEWKAEQETASAAAQTGEDSPALGQSLPMLDEAFGYLELDPNAVPTQTREAEAAPAEGGPAARVTDASGPDGEAATEPRAEDKPGIGPVTSPASGAQPNQVSVPAGASEPAAELGESEIKREARQRDRQVRAVLRQLLDELIAEYASDGRGIEIREIAGGYRMATKPECHDAVRSFVKSLKPPLKLSLPALETLAVIAYKQPVTAPEVNEIRGVDSSGVFGSLLSRKLIATAGRKQVIGRPILYKTTKEFLLRFGLKDVSELPSMEEFEKMAAIELSEEERAGEEETASESTEDAGPELDEPVPEEPASEAVATDALSNQADTEPAESESATPPACGQAETEPLPHE